MTYQVQVLKGGNWWATHTTTDVNEATNQYFHQIGLHAHAKQPDTSVRLLRQDASGNTTIPPLYGIPAQYRAAHQKTIWG